MAAILYRPQCVNSRSPGRNALWSLEICVHFIQNVRRLHANTQLCVIFESIGTSVCEWCLIVIVYHIFCILNLFESVTQCQLCIIFVWNESVTNDACIWRLWYQKQVQYIPRNMHTVFALLCFVVIKHWLIFPYPSGLLHWHCGNLKIAPVPAKQP